MKHLILSAFVIVAAYPVLGQQVINVDNTETNYRFLSGGGGDIPVGAIAFTNKYVSVSSGSPFFKSDFMKGVLFDAGGSRYVGLVRLNLIDNQINFQNAQGQEVVCTTPIEQLNLTDTTNGTQYAFVRGDKLHPQDKALVGVWFQVLVNGPVSLCLQQHKSVRETIPYGTSTVDQQIVDVNYYFLMVHGNFIPLGSWKDLQDQLPDKKDAVGAFIKEHHLKGHSDKDYIAVVNFYNGQP